MLLILFCSDISECKNISVVQRVAAVQKPCVRYTVTRVDIIDYQRIHRRSLREQTNVEVVFKRSKKPCREHFR